MKKKSNIHILVTSPEGYAKRLIQAFADSPHMEGIHPISIPMIETRIKIDSDDFQKFIFHLNDYDFLAFSSRKAIESFAVGLKEAGIMLPEALQLCAIGKDNELLSELFHRGPAFVTAEPSPQGIVNHLKRMPNTSGRRIAVLAPEVIGMEEPSIVPEFMKGLSSIGMYAQRITAYQTMAVSNAIQEATQQEILSEKYDAVLFTSGTEIKVFLQMIPLEMSLVSFMKDIKVLCYGPYTASCATAYGLKVDFVSKSFGSFQEFVSQLPSFVTL